MKKALSGAIATIAYVSAVVLITIASVVPVAATSLDKANQQKNIGVLKVHEIGTPSGTENNDSKVCTFNLEGFGLDAGRFGYLQFQTQGNNSHDNTVLTAKYTLGAANEDGYAISQDFNVGGGIIPNGHYKVTLYGKSDLTDQKAKSKVFKVDCDVVDTANATNTPATFIKLIKPVTPSTSEGPHTSSEPNTQGLANNGTLKIHEIGTPAKMMNNDPKVCAFDIEGFKFDAGQTGYLKFSVQGNDAPHGVASETVYAFGPADKDGYAISATKFNSKDGVKIANGHYKVTLYSNAEMTDEKAKSKVFKVTCDTPTGSPIAPTTPITLPNGGHVLGSTTTAVAPTVTLASMDKLRDAGTSISVTTIVAISLLATAMFVTKKATNIDRFVTRTD